MFSQHLGDGVPRPTGPAAGARSDYMAGTNPITRSGAERQVGAVYRGRLAGVPLVHGDWPRGRA